MNFINKVRNSRNPTYNLKELDSHPLTRATTANPSPLPNTRGSNNNNVDQALQIQTQLSNKRREEVKRAAIAREDENDALIRKALMQLAHKRIQDKRKR